MREVEAAARTLGLEIDIAEVGRAEDISPAFDKFTSRVQALYVCPDALMNANSVRINTLALGAADLCAHRLVLRKIAIYRRGWNDASVDVCLWYVTDFARL
jgi:hypothetical protein